MLKKLLKYINYGYGGILITFGLSFLIILLVAHYDSKRTLGILYGNQQNYNSDVLESIAAIELKDLSEGDCPEEHPTHLNDYTWAGTKVN